MKKGRRLIARYEGRCDACGDKIIIGDPIYWEPSNVARMPSLTYHSLCWTEPEYAAGRAQGTQRSAERALYGDVLVEQFDRDAEMFAYNHGLD